MELDRLRQSERPVRKSSANSMAARCWIRWPIALHGLDMLLCAPSRAFAKRPIGTQPCVAAMYKSGASRTISLTAFGTRCQTGGGHCQWRRAFVPTEPFGWSFVIGRRGLAFGVIEPWTGPWFCPGGLGSRGHALVRLWRTFACWSVTGLLDRELGRTRY